MRWIHREPKIGSTRIVWKFIWWPKELPVGDPDILKLWSDKGLVFAKESRFLWFYRVKQKYTEFMREWVRFNDWEDTCWADKDTPNNWRTT